jgi:hypothetical protein
MPRAEQRGAAIRNCRRFAAAASAMLAGALVVIAAVGSSNAAPIFAVIDATDAPDAQLDGQCASTHLGLCTLRAAIQEAEFAGGGHVVLSAGLGDYQLTIPAGAESNPGSPPSNATGDLDISTNVTVTGSGPGVTVIDGSNAVRLFDVHANGTLGLTGLTLQNGKADFDGATFHVHGGAIHNHGTLTLDHVAIVTSSSAPSWGGGGITNAGNGNARLSNVTVARNSSPLHGGGIENLGQLGMLNVTVAENTAPAAQGGGIYFGGSTTTAADVLVAKNTGGDCAIAAGTVTSSGANLHGDGTCGFNQGTDRTGDPGFEAGVFNGPPLFYPLLATSQAVDTGPLCQPTDIRGVKRPQDGNGDGVALCDTGSYEREPAGAQSSLSIRDARTREGRRRHKKLRFKVSLSARAKQTVSVRVATQDGTAKAGSDYVAKTATLTFKPREKNRKFSVELLPDRRREPNETFKVKLSSPSGAVVADGEAIGTIINDDD